MIKHVIIVHLHELTLKGKNRSWFEKILIKNLKKHLVNLPYKKINMLFGRIVIDNIDKNLFENYKESLSSVIGIRNFIFAINTDLNIKNLKEESLNLFKNITQETSFRVSARRQNKNFKYNSQEINNIVGEHIQSKTGLKVNLTKPDIKKYQTEYQSEQIDAEITNINEIEDKIIAKNVN